MNNLQKSALALYVIMGLLSFGHAWNRPWSQPSIDSGAKMLGTVAIGAVWPLYVSVILFED